MSQETLLLVDDEQDVVDALARTVRDRGYRILAATSGTKAMELLEQEKVDLLISDIDMPDMSGLELVTRVRKSKPDVVRFILTGVASLESAMAAINEGEVHRYLTKPWDTEELRSAIRDGLDRRKQAGSPEAKTPADALAGITEPLSPRLRETLEQLMTGACPKDIANNLGVSVHTARQYVKTLYRRFKVSSRAELMVTLYGRR
jgi:DNA-binding NarL/FixJ family response regulator